MGIENNISNLQSKVSTIEEFLEDLAEYSREVIAFTNADVPSEEVHAEFIKLQGNLGEIICRLAEYCSAENYYWD